MLSGQWESQALCHLIHPQALPSWVRKADEWQPEGGGSRQGRWRFPAKFARGPWPWVRRVPGRPATALLLGCSMWWTVSFRPGGRKATPQRSSFRLPWRTLRSGRDSRKSPMRWSWPRTAGGCACGPAGGCRGLARGARPLEYWRGCPFSTQRRRGLVTHACGKGCLRWLSPANLINSLRSSGKYRMEPPVLDAF